VLVALREGKKLDPGASFGKPAIGGAPKPAKATHQLPRPLARNPGVSAH